MTKDLSVGNPPVKGSFFGSCQIGSHKLNGQQQASIMSKAEYDWNNNRVALGIGIGSANTISLEAGHEFQWNKMGLDIHLKGESSKQLLKNTESKEVTLADKSQVTLTNQYRPSDVRVGLGAAATYRPSKGVKLGLGVEGGVVVPTTANNKIGIGDENVSFRHSHLPEGYITPKGSVEINLGKGISIVGDASLYDSRIGIKAQF